MIRRIKDWIYFKYGREVESRHIWMMVILIFSIMFLVVSLALNIYLRGGIGKRDKTVRLPNGEVINLDDIRKGNSSTSR